LAATGIVRRLDDAPIFHQADKHRMNNPFTEATYPDEQERSLVELAQQGNQEALATLVKAHQAWIYNIALKMVYEPEDAADITQEVLLKVITRLSTFQGQSKFRTWLYRIVANHVINMKKSAAEKMATSFDLYARSLDEIQDADLHDQHSVPVDLNLLVEEAKISCMSGMVLCLDREQRLIFILGELFGVSDTIGSELLAISRANFRQKLSRARKDLYNFMNEQCGLINKSNRCRCARKTKAFIELGIVDPEHLKFTSAYFEQIHAEAPARSQHYDNALEPKYATLYREHPFLQPPDFVESLREMVNAGDFRALFNLDK
jgi:RNA polymerase sigma factor (sigma-70 family)